MSKSEIARLMAVKNALSGTTSTPGWVYIRQIADNMVQKAISEALDEKERESRNDMTLKASALKNGFQELWNAIENAKTINPEADFGSGLGELETGDRTDA